MKIHIITIFPESFESPHNGTTSGSYFSSSIIWKAREKWLFELEIYKLNDFSDDNFKRVDDKAYWMHWQVISPEPLEKSIEYIFNKVWKKIPVIYMSPSWDLLTQEKIENYYERLEVEFIIICGHYEWIDERIIEMYVDYKISIWEYVLTSGELSASVFLDALIRHIPGVLGNIDSLEEDSFSKKFDRQKEYPVYTRPEEFKWKKVPEILLSGNHKEIEKWKKNNLG
jgi:tRNA (guanine37-N1)-methyltransferase